MLSPNATFQNISSEVDTTVPLVRLNWIATIGIVSLCACTMLNLNFFTRLFLKTEQVLSIFYLLSCLAILFSLRFPISKSIGPVGLLWLFNVAFFLAISTRFGLGVDPSFFTSPSSNFYRVITAQLITVSAAVAARHLMLAGKMQLLLRIVFGMTLLAAATILLSKFIPIFAMKSGQGRVGGVFTDANRAGHALCYSAAFGFACLLRERSNFLRVVMFGGLAMLVPCLLITNSRSAIIFMVLLVGIQAVTTPILKQKGAIVAMLIIAAGIPVGVGFMLSQRGSHVNIREAKNLESQQERLESFFRILRGEMSEEDTGHRFTVGAVGLKYFASSPVIGVGFHKLVKMPEVNLGCHNTFIRVLGEGGIFSGILYMGTVFAIAFVSFRCKIPEVRALGLGFTAMYSCSAMVAHTLLTSRISNVSMGITLGLLAGAATLQQRQKQLRRAAMRSQQQPQQAPTVPQQQLPQSPAPSIPSRS